MQQETSFRNVKGNLSDARLWMCISPDYTCLAHQDSLITQLQVDLQMNLLHVKHTNKTFCGPEVYLSTSTRSSLSRAHLVLGQNTLTRQPASRLSSMCSAWANWFTVCREKHRFMTKDTIITLVPVLTRKYILWIDIIKLSRNCMFIKILKLAFERFFSSFSKFCFFPPSFYEF